MDGRPDCGCLSHNERIYGCFSHNERIMDVFLTSELGMSSAHRGLWAFLPEAKPTGLWEGLTQLEGWRRRRCIYKTWENMMAGSPRLWMFFSQRVMEEEEVHIKTWENLS